MKCTETILINVLHYSSGNILQNITRRVVSSTFKLKVELNSYEDSLENYRYVLKDIIIRRFNNVFCFSDSNYRSMCENDLLAYYGKYELDYFVISDSISTSANIANYIKKFIEKELCLKSIHIKVLISLVN